MMPDTTFVALLSALIAAFAAWIAWRAPQHVEIERQRAVARELKVDTLRRAIGLRSQPPTQEWLNALNEIAVVYNDAPKVLAALLVFSRQIWRTGGHDNDDLVELFTVMMEDLGLTAAGLDGEFLLRPLKARRE